MPLVGVAAGIPHVRFSAYRGGSFPREWPTSCRDSFKKQQPHHVRQVVPCTDQVHELLQKTRVMQGVQCPKP